MAKVDGDRLEDAGEVLASGIEERAFDRHHGMVIAASDSGDHRVRRVYMNTMPTTQAAPLRGTRQRSLAGRVVRLHVPVESKLEMISRPGGRRTARA